MELHFAENNIAPLLQDNERLKNEIDNLKKGMVQLTEEYRLKCNELQQLKNAVDFANRELNDMLGTTS